MHWKEKVYQILQSGQAYVPHEGWGKNAPHLGSLEFNTIFQFSLFCKHEGKEDEIPFVQAVIVL